MTNEERLKVWAECARHDGDEEAAESMEWMLQTFDAVREARQRAEAERDALKQERDEDQGVIRVWRGRCDRAEAELAAVRRALADEADDGPLDQCVASLMRRFKHRETLILESRKAERERDEAREQVRTQAESLQHLQERLTRAEAEVERVKVARDSDREHYVKRHDNISLQLERAEADNAALVQAIPRALNLVDVWMGTDEAREIDAILRITGAPHPGAALLEESEKRRALLEAVASACRGLGPVTEEVRSVLGNTLDELSALRQFRKAARYSEEVWRRVRGGGDLDHEMHAALDALDALVGKP